MKTIILAILIALLIATTLFTHIFNNSQSQQDTDGQANEILPPQETKKEIDDDTSTKETATTTEESSGQNTGDQTELPYNAVVQNDFNELISKRQVGEDIVIGYIWRTKADSPKFQTVRIPIWDLSAMENEYQVDIWDGDSFIFYQNAKPAVDNVVFPEGGVSQFRVSGIDPAYGICPGERSRFTWGLTLATTGTFDAERIPITIDGSVTNTQCKITY